MNSINDKERVLFPPQGFVCLDSVEKDMSSIKVAKIEEINKKIHK